MRHNIDKTLAARWARLADQPEPLRPADPVGRLTNHILTYTSPTYVPVVLRHLDRRIGGLVVANTNGAGLIHQTTTAGYDGPILIDPAAYQHYTATPDAPFWQPEGQLIPATLDETLDQQLRAGACAALTPTGYIQAGDLASLQAAARMVADLGRQDVILVAPIDVSLLNDAFILDLIATLAAARCPIGLILGGQDDPLNAAADQLIPNLRDLAVSVALLPLRTDLTAFDLVAHGAFAAAIGIGSRWHHAPNPTIPTSPDNPDDDPPSVLFAELLSWWPGTAMARLYGPRERAARTCGCTVCDQQRPTRLVKLTHRAEAISHGIAVWSSYANDLFDKPTMRDRATYWRNLCDACLREHGYISQQLHLYGGRQLQPRAALRQWATLPPWPVDSPTSST